LESVAVAYGRVAVRCNLLNHDESWSRGGSELRRGSFTAGSPRFRNKHENKQWRTGMTQIDSANGSPAGAAAPVEIALPEMSLRGVCGGLDGRSGHGLGTVARPRRCRSAENAYELALRYAEDGGNGRGCQRLWLGERQSGGARAPAKGTAAVLGVVGCAL
jgi:hypothetical protein